MNNENGSTRVLIGWMVLRTPGAPALARMTSDCFSAQVRAVRSLQTRSRRQLLHYSLFIVRYSFVLLLFSSATSAQLHYNDFSSLAGLSMQGVAVARGGLINLTPGRMDEAGAVWSTRKQHVTDGFISRFTFRIRDTAGQPDDEGKNGGDGIAFVIQNLPAGSSALGATGGQLGYGRLGNLLAVEFDTYRNSGNEIRDPNGNHVSIQTSGAAHFLSWGAATQVRNLADGQIHTATIEYVNGTLRVYLDACAPLLLATDIDLSQFADGDGDAWIGFTSATGSAWESHEMLSWQFNPLGAIRTYRGPPCDADSVTLTVRGDFLSYRWSNGSTARSITVGRSGTYDVTISDTNACSSLTFTWSEKVELSSIQKPPIQLSGNAAFCEGDSVVLSAPANLTSYRWSTGQITRSITVRTSGRYAVTIVDGRGCTVTSDSITVNVTLRPRPGLNVSGPLRFCSGASIELATDPGFPSYLWSDGRTTRSITVTESGRYFVLVGAPGGCRGSSDTVTVEVVPAPAPVIQIQRGSLCESDSVLLDAGPGYVSYLWSTGERTRTIEVESAGDYFVTVVNNLGCATTSDTVKILPGGVLLPTISITGEIPFCRGESLTLTVDQAYSSYTWNNGATGRSLVVTAGGRYIVSVVDSAGCVAETSIDVPEPIDPPSAEITASGPTSLCEGESVTLSVGATSAPVLWSTGSTEREIVVRFADIYHVRVGTGRCVSYDTIRIDFSAGPIASAGADRQICSGDSVRLQAGGGTTFRWTPSTGLSCTDCASPMAAPEVTTLYVVEVGDGRPCSSFDTVVVSVVPAARVDVGPDRTICAGDSVRLRAEGATAYTWSPASGLSCFDCADPIVSPAITTTYIVTAAGGGICARPDTVTINVEEEGLVVQSYIERTVFGAPGERIIAPLILETRAFLGGVDSIDLEIRYNPMVAAPAIGSDPSLLLSGSVLSGWRVVVEPSATGTLLLHLGSSGTGVLTGGRLIDLPFTLYLGDSAGTELAYDMVVHGNRCLQIGERDGRLQLDSICGLSVRLIEMGGTKYALGEITPNPALSGASLSFTIGLDAPTRIRLFDLQGGEVGRPIDEYLLPGEYQLQLQTEELPAGVYLLWLESGDFSATRRLVIRH